MNDREKNRTILDTQVSMAGPAPPLTISDVAQRLRPLGQRHPIQRIDVFGSVARGNATSASDVDLLVTLDPNHTVTTDELLEMAGEAEELVGAPIDFVLRSSLERSAKLETRRHILETAVCIYGS